MVDSRQKKKGRFMEGRWMGRTFVLDESADFLPSPEMPDFDDHLPPVASHLPPCSDEETVLIYEI